ncbi:MAG: enoyl-CoA hydratase/isomerase family protein [Ilumatobacteraceae bacterium]
MGVLMRTEGPAVVVTMDWPDKRNAVGPAEAGEIGDALAAAVDEAQAGVVLTGNGGFCAGGDLEQFLELSATKTAQDLRDSVYTNVHAALRAIERSPVPVVAAVDGAAIGLGFDYAVMCDMCFVGPGGWLMQGWAMAGLVHGAAGSWFLEHHAPGAAWKLIAEQTRLDGPAAAAIGLAETADGSALDAALARIAKLATLPRAVLEGYTTLQRRMRFPSEEYRAACVDLQAGFICSPEFRANAEQILAARKR